MRLEDGTHEIQKGAVLIANEATRPGTCSLESGSRIVM